MKKWSVRALALLAASCAVSPVIAQPDTPQPVTLQQGRAAPVPRVRPSVDTYPSPASYPNENKAAVAEHLAKATQIAGKDLFQDMAHRCIISPVLPRRVAGIQYNGRITPTKIFDDLYEVGQNEVSAQALTTSDGIILFDTLNSEDEARNILVPNMIRLGLDPKQIKYIVISHEHGDHYGGARWLQLTYGAKVIASSIAWDGMQKAAENGPFRDTPIPTKDIVMADGQTLTLGGTTLTFYITPGHTPGVLSAIYKVRDNGAPHTVGYFGGTGGGRNAATDRAQIASLQRWLGIANAAGVDAIITNHPLHSEALEKEYMLAYRQPGQPNPFVLGRDVYQRYVQVQEECARVALAREGFTE